MSVREDHRSVEWGKYAPVSLVIWIFFSLYAMWNVVGLLVFLVSTVVVYASLLRVADRYALSKQHVILVAIVIGSVLPLLAFVVDTTLYESLFVFDEIAIAGSVLPGIAGYFLVDSEDRRLSILLGSLVVLPLLYLLGLWFWITPPCTLCDILGVPIAKHVPFLFLILESDATAFLRIWGGLDLPIVRTISMTATGIGALVFLYVLSSMVGHILYTSQKGVEKVENLTIVLVTIASEEVRDALYESIEHNRELLSEYEFYVLIDEGADLQPELEEMDVDLAVVPDLFESNAIAKGRAMQYFVEHYVAEDRWYAFIDDDNLIQGREFLYEIPKQEADGRLVMNSILIPRRGGSTIAFAIDHMRTLFDFTFFRTCTGLLGRPYAGLHGELLCARGDVLKTVGFDKESIVEDFVFADELIQRDIPTWQSQTATSILSPHTLDDYFTQRARWFTGKLEWLPRCSPGTIFVTGLIQGVWLIGIFGGWIVAAIWFLFGPPLEIVYLTPAISATAIYTLVYSIGIARMGIRHLPKVLLAPIYATVEHAAPYVSVLKRPDKFKVIKK